MDVVIETSRLLLRRFTIDDVQLIYELNKDPEVTRYTNDPVNNYEQAKAVLSNHILPQYELYGHGRWAVHDRDDLAFYGWCGLKYRPEWKEVDLGYRYSVASWGKGFATEAAQACLEYGFSRLGLHRIVGRAVTENVASCRVLEKCGMRFIGLEWMEGHLARTYEKLNPPIPPANHSANEAI